MYIFTIDAERYDESSLNIVQIESLINKHRNIIGKIKKNKRYYEGEHDIKRRQKKYKGTSRTFPILLLELHDSIS